MIYPGEFNVHSGLGKTPESHLILSIETVNWDFTSHFSILLNWVDNSENLKMSVDKTETTVYLHGSIPLGRS